MSQTYTIGTPKFVGAASAARRAKDRRRRTMLSSLMLTPMVDMFSLLVIFLLQFFSAAPDFNLTSGVDLPQSVSQRQLREAPVLSIVKSDVLLEHQRLGSLSEILNNAAPLATALDALKARWLAEHPHDAFTGEIDLEADQSLKSTTVAQVMAILSAQQFGSIQLVVIGE